MNYTRQGFMKELKNILGEEGYTYYPSDIYKEEPFGVLRLSNCGDRNNPEYLIHMDSDFGKKRLAKKISEMVIKNGYYSDYYKWPNGDYIVRTSQYKGDLD